MTISVLEIFGLTMLLLLLLRFYWALVSLRLLHPVGRSAASWTSTARPSRTPQLLGCLGPFPPLGLLWQSSRHCEYAGSTAPPAWKQQQQQLSSPPLPHWQLVCITALAACRRL